MNPRYRLSTPLKIIKIEERTITVGAHKEGDVAVFHTAPDGWWIVLSDGTSLGVGHEKPPFTEGQEVLLSLSPKAPDEPAAPFPEATPRNNPSRGSDPEPIFRDGSVLSDRDLDHGRDRGVFVDPSAPLRTSTGGERRREDPVRGDGDPVGS